MNTRYLLVFVCAMLLCGCQQHEPPVSSNPALRVHTVQAQSQLLANIVELSGTVLAEPNRSARVTSVVAGVLDFVGPRVGDCVEKGEVVARLQDSIQSAQVKQNQASLMLAQANLSKATNGSRPQEIQQARGALDAAKANATNATQNRERLQKLFEQEVSAGRDYDLSVSQERVAQAQLKAAEAAMSLSLKGPRQEDRASAAAQAQQAAGLLEQARANLAFTRLRSPIRGVVAERYLDVGEQCGPTAPVMLIVDPTTVIVQLNLPVGYNNSVYPGQTVEILLPDNPMPLAGSVASVGMKLDAITNTVPVQVSLRNDALKLKLGMVVKARIITERHVAVVVPKQCLISSADNPNRRVVDTIRHGESKAVVVVTGISSGDLVEIKSGIEAGDLVIRDMSYQLPDGTKVSRQ